MRLREAIDLFLERYFATCDRSPRTVAAYGIDLRQFSAYMPGDPPLGAVAPEDLEGWAAELRGRGLAAATIRRKFAVLRVFFGYWLRHRVLERSPLWNLRLDYGRQRTLPKTLTVDEVRRLLARAENDFRSKRSTGGTGFSDEFLALRDWVVVELLFATGIRVGEAVALHLDDLRLEERSFLVRGKGGRHRMAFLTERRSYEALRDYSRRRRELPAQTNRLLLNGWGASLSTQSIRLVLRRLAKSAGISRRITPHMIRHTAATLLLEHGADLRAVQTFLGHSSIVTTQRYAHVAGRHMRATLERCHPGIAIGR